MKPVKPQENATLGQGLRPEDRRRHERIDAEIEVAFATPHEFVVEYTKNISKGGIFIRTRELPDPNAVVELKLRFPDNPEEVSILAKVARTVTVSDPKNPGGHLYGVGFYFIEWSMHAKKVFDGYYQRLQTD